MQKEEAAPGKPVITRANSRLALDAGGRQRQKCSMRKATEKGPARSPKKTPTAGPAWQAAAASGVDMGSGTVCGLG